MLIDEHRRVDAERAREVITWYETTRGVCIVQAAIDDFLQRRVIASECDEFAVSLCERRSEAIETRVADVRESEKGGAVGILAKERGNERRTHAGAARIAMPFEEDAFVGTPHRALEFERRIRVIRLPDDERFVQGVDGKTTCDLTGLMSAHAIGDGKKSARGVGEHAVFVVRAHPTDVGERGAAEESGVWQVV